MAKTITDKLKSALSAIISDEQSAFFGGRLIMHNALIAYKLLYLIKNKHTKSKGRCAIKLDMLKAYDRAECFFIANLLVTLEGNSRLHIYGAIFSSH